MQKQLLLSELSSYKKTKKFHLEIYHSLIVKTELHKNAVFYKPLTIDQ